MMNEQMIEHLIYRIGALEKQAKNTEARLSKAEQQMEVMCLKYQWIAVEFAAYQLQQGKGLKDNSWWDEKD